jgi:hypothetical protein
MCSLKIILSIQALTFSDFERVKYLTACALLCITVPFPVKNLTAVQQNLDELLEEKP